jgi:hypothetical protein
METQTRTTKNKELVSAFISRVFNEHNADATGEYFSRDVQWHGGTLGTIEGSAIQACSRTAPHRTAPHPPGGRLACPLGWG